METLSFLIVAAVAVVTSLGIATSGVVVIVYLTLDYFESRQAMARTGSGKR